MRGLLISSSKSSVSLERLNWALTLARVVRGGRFMLRPSVGRTCGGVLWPSLERLQLCYTVGKLCPLRHTSYGGQARYKLLGYVRGDSARYGSG